MLTDAEKLALRKVGEAYRAIASLPQCHASEEREARYHVHALQLLLMSRSTVREHPELFTHEPNFK